MPNEKYLDYAGLQYYHEKLQLELGDMAITDDDLSDIFFDELGIPPTLPENWTVSSDGTLDVSLSNAYSYWPEGAGTKTISIINGTTADISTFFLKLTDAGNFFVEWGSNIQWKNGSEPEWQAFHEDIIMFKSDDGGLTWTAQVVQTYEITPYWKLSVKVPWKQYSDHTGYNSEDAYYVRLNLTSLSNDTIIDWGDGSSTNVTNTSAYYVHEHEYAESGTYHIKVTSNNFHTAALLECVGMEWITSDLDAWSPYTDTLYSIDSPYPLISGIWRDTSSSNHFEENSFSGCCKLCKELIQIPEKLFYNNPQTTNFVECFESCSSLAFLPARLFEKNTLVDDFGYCFFDCTSLTNFKLIIGSPSVTSFYNFVSDASNVTRILCVPPNSTTYNTARSYANSSHGITVSTVETDCLDVFEYTVQTDLSEFDDPSWDDDYSPLVAAVPIEPVQNASASLTIDWGDGNAVELQPSSVVETNLIHTYATAGTYQITVFSSKWSDYRFIAVDFVEGSDPSSSDPVIQTFRDKLVSLDAPMPPLANTDLIYWFQYCPHLTTINSHLFDNLPNVTSAKGCFARCESLTTVPEGLFAKNTAITSFSECFKNCFGLQTIPAGLFANNTVAVDFSGCFDSCTSLQSIPSELFDKNTAATNFRYCFGNCYEIQTIPENLFASNTAVTDFSFCFYDCNSLGGFTIHIGSSLVAYADIFVTSKSGTTRIVYVPSGSNTQTTFNKYASSLKLTVRGE